MANEKKCPECGSANLTFDPHLGEIICNGCGLVVENSMIDMPTKKDKGDYPKVKNQKNRCKKIERLLKEENRKFR